MHIAFSQVRKRNLEPDTWYEFRVRVAGAVSGGLGYGITLASVLGCVAFSLLELFVAFLQAYIFTFLLTLFIGAAVHHH